MNEEVPGEAPVRVEATAAGLVDWEVRQEEAGHPEEMEVATAAEEAEMDPVSAAEWEAEEGQMAMEATGEVHTEEPASTRFWPGSFACTRLNWLEVDSWQPSPQTV